MFLTDFIPILRRLSLYLFQLHIKVTIRIQTPDTYINRSVIKEHFPYISFVSLHNLLQIMYVLKFHIKNTRVITHINEHEGIFIIVKCYEPHSL
jgi:hypothetical protein